MHRFLYYLLLAVCFSLFFCGTSYAQKNNLHQHQLLDINTNQGYTIQTDEPMVLLFLSPECPLCQGYTQTINQLQRQFGSEVKFMGIFSGKSHRSDDIKQFADKYKLGIPMYLDPDFKLTQEVGASVTPSAALYTKGVLQYIGAIDNAVPELGKKRVVVTQFYLQDAVESVLHGRPILITKTEAKGCYIHTR
ncbi:redoxin domain-containing protein [Sphingobacterium sp. lm-10]|uniref:redoxin domain-containing protein n=1 Tax=Sphingobacterium sp. lm-10 TaxID=2944904 RepID=UPI00202226CE|nr:redoxin domain-containing protein [Sphingobacterium sp. lm-10]MCL7987844.1 redoxin domain-containing protein [Sphingobacterium sp. lm-10]